MININRMISHVKNNRFQKDTLIVLFLKIIGIAILFGLSLFLTKNFDPHFIGKYDFSRSFILIAGSLALLGTNQAMIYYSGILKAKALTDLIFHLYVKMLIIISISSVVLIVSFSCLNESRVNSFLNKEDGYDLVMSSIYAIWFFGVFLLNVDTFRALGKITLSEFLRNVLNYIPFFLFAVILLSTDQEEYIVTAYLLGFTLLAAITTGMLLYYFRKKQYKTKDPVSLYSYVNIIKTSYPMALSTVSFFLMQSVDILLLVKFVSFEQVAFYAISAKISGLVSLGLLAVNVTIAPKISELFERRMLQELGIQIRKATRFIVLLSLPVITLLCIFPSFILHLFGEEYTAGKYVLLILVMGQFIRILCGSASTYMNMTRKQHILQRTLFLALIVNIILNIYLIPLYGIEGAAFATALTTILWNLTVTVIIYIKDGIRLFLY